MKNALFRGLRPAALLLLATLGAASLTGCETARGLLPSFLQPYRPDVQQGNVVTKEMVEQLRPGMTTDQVRFLLGTPMANSVFHRDRWDYVYYLKRGKGSEVQNRRLTVFFKEGRLDRFESDEMPAETMADNLILGRDAKKMPKPASRPTNPGTDPAGPIYR